MASLTLGSSQTYSPNEHTAESQLKAPSRSCKLCRWLTDIINRLRGLFASEHSKTSRRKQDPALDDSPFRQYCIKNANVWKLYMDLAKEFDKNLAELFNSDLDPLLIFAGLFSAILSAFLIEIRKGLQEDLQSVTNNLLTVLIQSQHNSTAAEIPPSSTFVPTLSSRWVNGLWFTSLVFSLISALGASVAKGWVTQFSSNVSGSSWSDVSLHCERLRDLERWRLTMIIECLPILIHIVFFLFAAGLVVLLFNDDLPIAIVVLVLTAVVGAAYIGNSIVSAYYLNSPLRTPVSGMLRYIFTCGWRAKGVRSFPSEEGSQKAQALLWLLAQSTDGLTVNATVRALAGLPFTRAVQDELSANSTSSPLSNLLSTELVKNSPDAELVNATMFALLYFVSASPESGADDGSADALRGLVKVGGALANSASIPLGVQAAALCLKGRIIRLLCPSDEMLLEDKATLLKWDVLVLAKTCADTCLRRLSTELALEPGGTFPSEKVAPGTVNIIPAVIEELTVHLSLVGTYLERRLNQATLNLDLSTLLAGLTKKTSLHRRYADLFAELSSGSSFRQQFQNTKSAATVSSAIQSEDEDVRDSLVIALTNLNNDDKSREIILDGFPSFMNCLNTLDASILSDVSDLLVGLADQEEIRVKMAASDLMHRIPTAINGKTSGARRSLMQTYMGLLSHDDIRRSDTLENILITLLGFIATGIFRESTEKIIFLSEQENILGAFSTPEVQDKLFFMLESSDWEVRRNTVHCVKILSGNGGIRDAIATPELLQRIVLLVQDEDSDTRQATLEAIVALSQYDCVRAIIATPEVVQRILTLHHDREWLVRETMVKTIIDLLKYRTHARPVSDIPLDEFRSILAETGILQRIISLIEDEDWDVRQAVLRALASLAEHAEIRMVISGQDVVHTVISLLGHDSRWVRRTSLEAMIALSEFKDIWTSTGITELKSERGRMLNDGDENIRYDAIQLIVTLCEHEVLHEALYDTEILHQVVSILDDADEDVRGAAVGATLALSRPQNAPPALAAPEVQERIILKLADPHSVVREASLVAVTQFLKQNLIPPAQSSKFSHCQIMRLERSLEKMLPSAMFVKRW